jgi:hypothetical protein
MSVSKWYSKFGILKVERQAMLKQGVLAFKVSKGRIHPNGPFDFFNHPNQSKRAKNTYRIPIGRLNVVNHSLSCRLPAVWNQLPDSLKEATSIGSFKTRFTELLRLEQHTEKLNCT